MKFKMAKSSSIITLSVILLMTTECGEQATDLVRTSTMTNRMTCRELYDHCVYGNVTGDRGLRSPSSDKLPPVRMRYQQWRLSRCFCDVSLCRKYGDCCPDMVLGDIEAAPTAAADDTAAVVATGLDDNRHNRWECHGLVILNKHQRKHASIYMLSSCPRTWQDDSARQLCRRTTSSSDYNYDYTLDVPVISQVTNTTYRNIYCAICNDDMEDLASLAISIHCPKLHPNCTNDWSQWQYMAGQQRWRHVAHGDHLNVTFELIIPHRDMNHFFQQHAIRTCRAGLVDTCSPSWTGDLERRLCSTYALIVADGPTGTTYKNRHCALCNGVGAADEPLSCPSTKEPNQTYKGDGSLTHSYSMLVDFMGDDVERSGAITCGYGEICDILRKRCRKFTCGKHFRLNSSGRCIAVATNESDGDVIEQDCPKVSFYEGQFVFLTPSKDLIYVNETDTIYNVTEYEMSNGSTVLVCALPDDHSRHGDWQFTDGRAIVSTACVIASLVCLAVHILVHLYVPQLLNLPGKNLLSLSCALFVAQSLFTFAIAEFEDERVACVAVAALVHLCFLASFFWMNVMAFDVCRTFSSKRYLMPSTDENNSTFLKYSLYAWSMPLIIVGVALINDVVFEFLPGELRTRYAQEDHLCWINNHRALLVFFVLPLAVLVTKNTFLFVFTVAGIARTRHATRFARRDSSMGKKSRPKPSSETVRIVLYVKLALIMGLTWAFGLVASLAKVEVLWYLFIVFNALQGAFIFFAFTFKSKILRLIKDRLRGKKARRGGAKGNSFNKTQVTSKSIQSAYNVNANCVPCSL